MKTELPNLPESQKSEIKLIAKEISKIKWVWKIILFWSFARWDYVIKDVTEEYNSKRVYESDYDILVIVKYYKKDYNIKINETIEKLRKEKNIQRSIDVIVESVFHVNKMLKENRYFFSDIVKEGILLYDNQKDLLAKAEILSLEEKRKIQKQDFKLWFEGWDEFLIWYKFFLKENLLNKSAFILHQTIESYITWYLLVKTWYRPKTHDLEKLYGFLIKNNSHFEKWFDLTDSDEKTKFELLRKAYVDARYSYDYKITKQELKFLEKKVVYLRNIIETLCKIEMGEEITKKTQK